MAIVRVHEPQALFIEEKGSRCCAGLQQQNSVRVRNTAGGRFFIDEAVILVFQLQAVLFLYKKFPRADRLHRLCRFCARRKRRAATFCTSQLQTQGLPARAVFARLSPYCAVGPVVLQLLLPANSFWIRAGPRDPTTEYMGAQGKRTGVPSLSLVHDRTSSQRRAALVSAGRFSLPAEPELQRDVPHFCPG